MPYGAANLYFCSHQPDRHQLNMLASHSAGPLGHDLLSLFTRNFATNFICPLKDARLS